MSADLITVACFGHADSELASKIRLVGFPDIQSDEFDVRLLRATPDVAQRLAEVKPHVIFTFGSLDDVDALNSCSLDMRRRWVHFDDPTTDPVFLAQRACEVYVDVATMDRFSDTPLVSVFTPTYNTGDRLYRAFNALLAQSYANWEWVMYDDSPDDETFKLLRTVASQDPRVRVFRSDGTHGVIGEVKRRACGLARGTILVELDHDDELLPDCLALVVDAFKRFPDAGFAYTDCAEIFEDGENAQYGDGYGFGFGGYRHEQFRGHTYAVTNYPSINSKTVRHIVGMPNHVRAWTRDAYNKAGGYASEIHVADDFELCIRTFLTTRMVHIQHFGYIQYLSRSNSNTQRKRNKEIQRLVRLFAARYEPEIHARFVELGVKDFIWNDGQLNWDTPNPDPAPIANYVYR